MVSLELTQICFLLNLRIKSMKTVLYIRLISTKMILPLRYNLVSYPGTLHHVMISQNMWSSYIFFFVWNGNLSVLPKVNIFVKSWSRLRVASNIEQVMASTPYKVPTIRQHTSHHENYPSSTNQICRTLLKKQGRAHKWCTPMDPRIWPSKNRTTSSSKHSSAMWGYGM